LKLPTTQPDATHVFHQYVVRAGGRDDLKAFLFHRAIGTAVHYPWPVHLQPAYQGRLFQSKIGLIETEGAAREVMSLPMYPQLTDEQVRLVCAAVQEWAGTVR
jgi:hypothetical protein